jgi:hypothetical protein
LLPDEDENVEEDEEEDMDLNPFLKGMPSPEASSSLSSEVEGLEEGVKGVRSDCKRMMWRFESWRGGCCGKWG